MPHCSRRLALFLPASILLAGLPGCAGWISHTLAREGASVRLESLGEKPAGLDASLPYGAYASMPSDESLFASDVPLEEILKGGVHKAQFIHAQLLWVPKPGNTPVDETATNLTLRYVVISEGQVGLYGGAGFAWPRGEAGRENLSLVIEGSSLSLLARTEGFVDRLTPARLVGTMHIAPNNDEARAYRRGMSQVVTDGLGASRWVDGHSAPLQPDQVLALLLGPNAASTEGAAGSRSGS
jgi:hypothetical protein